MGEVRKMKRRYGRMMAGIFMITVLICTPALAKNGLIKDFPKKIYPLIPAPAPASIWYVDGNAASDGDGLSWETAFKNIEDAVEAADPTDDPCADEGDTIWVARGHYYPDHEILVTKVITLLGGFRGFETDADERDPDRYKTIIHGGGHRCFNIGVPCTIDGFTLQDGSTAVAGGCMLIEDAISYCSAEDVYISPAINDCEISHNDADTGGAVYIRGSDPTFFDCTFTDNTAKTGGAIYHASASPQIKRCTFSDNTSTAPSSLGGGAIAGYRRNMITDKRMTITNCLFAGNWSESWGGAISYNQVYPTITHCTFTQNEAGIAGGGFHGNANSEAPKIRNSIFWGDYPDELDITTASTYLDVRYCDIEGGWTGTEPGNISTDPFFLDTDNFRLTQDSPCIDAGADGLGAEVDLTGTARPLDGDEDGTATTDMGAYEFDPDELPLYPAPIAPVKVVIKSLF